MCNVYEENSINVRHGPILGGNFYDIGFDNDVGLEYTCLHRKINNFYNTCTLSGAIQQMYKKGTKIDKRNVINPCALSLWIITMIENMF